MTGQDWWYVKRVSKAWYIFLCAIESIQRRTNTLLVLVFSWDLLTKENKGKYKIILTSSIFVMNDHCMVIQWRRPKWSYSLSCISMQSDSNAGIHKSSKFQVSVSSWFSYHSEMNSNNGWLKGRRIHSETQITTVWLAALEKHAVRQRLQWDYRLCPTDYVMYLDFRHPRQQLYLAVVWHWMWIWTLACSRGAAL